MDYIQLAKGVRLGAMTDTDASRLIRYSFSSALQFAGLVFGLAGLVVSAAQANSTLLVCDYPADMGRPSAEQAALVPRSLSISAAEATVQWNGMAVPARVSESEIRFAWSGYEYTLNRLSGEIRFYSPVGLAAWREQEQKMLRSALARRIPLVEAKGMVVEAGRDREFEYREHFGQCRVVGNKMF